jgi:hypothetical protein
MRRICNNKDNVPDLLIWVLKTHMPRICRCSVAADWWCPRRISHGLRRQWWEPGAGSEWHEWLRLWWWLNGLGSGEGISWGADARARLDCRPISQQCRWWRDWPRFWDVVDWGWDFVCCNLAHRKSIWCDLAGELWWTLAHRRWEGRAAAERRTGSISWRKCRRFRSHQAKSWHFFLDVVFARCWANHRCFLSLSPFLSLHRRFLWRGPRFSRLTRHYYTCS